MKLRTAQLDDVFNEFEFVLSRRRELRWRMVLWLGRKLYKFARWFYLASLRVESR